MFFSIYFKYDLWIMSVWPHFSKHGLLYHFTDWYITTRVLKNGLNNGKNKCVWLNVTYIRRKWFLGPFHCRSPVHRIQVDTFDWWECLDMRAFGTTTSTLCRTLSAHACIFYYVLSLFFDVLMWHVTFPLCFRVASLHSNSTKTLNVRWTSYIGLTRSIS